MTDRTENEQRTRMDKWLWAARFYKTRALAADAIDAGRIEINDERVKRSRAVQVGDRVRIRRPPFEQLVVVRAVSDSRGPATVAATLYEETADSRQAREAMALQLKGSGAADFRDRGRPGKKERRDIDRLRGRSDT